MTIDTTLAAVALLTALNGFLGEKIEDSDVNHPKIFLRKVRPAGWSLLVLSIFTFVLAYHKNAHSFEGRMHSIYPNFEQIVHDNTGFELDDWEKYMSYRVSLRFELQQLYSKTFPERTRPESMKTTLQELGQSGAIPKSLCESLDFIRWNSYYVEWGTDGPCQKALSGISKRAESALPELSRISESINIKNLVPNPKSPCGTDPTREELKELCK